MVDTAPAAPASAPASTPAPAAATPAAATPPPSPAPPAPASVAASPPAAAPAAPAAAPASLRPQWLPESHWNAQLNTINIDALQKDFEGKAALSARKPEDIKLLNKLPDDVKLPDGATWKINEKDPYVPELRQIAIKHGLSQDVVNDVMLMDARVKIGDYLAEQNRQAEENKKLGDNAKARKDAIFNWLNASGLEPPERLALAAGLTDAAAVTALEKVIQKIIGGVAANAGGQAAPAEPSKPARSIEQRMYPNMRSVNDPLERKAG